MARPGGNHRRPASGLRTGAAMAGGTLASRVTGMIRTVLIAAALGMSGAAEAYNVANTIPNMLFTLLAGGALNAVFVPRMMRAMKDKAEGDAYANRLLTLTVLGLGSLTAVCVVAAPKLVELTAQNLATGTQGEGYELAVSFARYCLPQILFYGLFTVVGQILNSRGSFASMMWTPVLNNIVVIVTFALFIAVAQGGKGLTPEETRLLGIGTTLGIVVQALGLFPYLKASGLRVRPRFDWRGTGIRHDLRLARWTLALALVSQVGYTVIVNLAVAAGGAAAKEGVDGGVGLTPYTNAQTLWMLPQSLITVTLVTAFFPRMGLAAADGRLADLREQLSRSLRLSGVAIVPAAFALLVFGPQITTVVFLHGRTGTADVAAMAQMLAALSLGLIPFSAQYVLLRGFYAMEDTRTPFMSTLCITAFNAGGAGLAYLLLPPRWAVVGMAAAYTFAYTVGLAVTAFKLRRRLDGARGRLTARTYGRLVVAGAVSAGVGLVVVQPFGALNGVGPALLQLAVGGTAMAAAFVAIGKLLRIREVGIVVNTARARLGV